MITTSLIITLIGMGVIFLVLGVLYFTIIGLEKLFPYTEPPAPAATEDDAEVVAVIQAAISMFRRQRVSKISVKPVK
jgi:Na+-transporting methylmalonyl-CoA/oxaloacetate decarboxylase gamma subunit